MTEPAAQLQSSPETPLPRTSTMAIVSLITGILAYVMLPFVGAIAAVITGHLAKKEIRESGGWLIGDGLATAGLILGYVHLALGVVGLCVIMASIALGIATPFLCLPFTNEFDMGLRALAGL
ncbi:MAG: hypothetical protein A2Z66_12925 [Chloroflexi bacterium RBG_13_66_10]|nr:MAG: hypothetical protein A2Z66_12925 [Chloroflexi bacterium RBG_13_66_10]